MALAMSWVVAGGQERPPLPATPAVSPIERFLQRNDPPLRTYRGRRRLEARNARFKAEGWMEVTTELDPNQGLSWTVTGEGGSGYIRNRVLRKALEGEVAAIRAGDPAKAAITERNYTFAVSDSGDDGTVTVRIEPRRRDVLLVSGFILLTRDDGDLVQIEGRLSKSPSFWTRTVDVIRRYCRRDGVLIPIRMESTANVRIAGPSDFLMTYSYETVNGESVDGPQESTCAARTLAR